MRQRVYLGMPSPRSASVTRDAHDQRIIEGLRARTERSTLDEEIHTVTRFSYHQYVGDPDSADQTIKDPGQDSALIDPPFTLAQRDSNGAVTGAGSAVRPAYRNLLRHTTDPSSAAAMNCHEPSD